jgi:hypothetical protein
MQLEDPQFAPLIVSGQEPTANEIATLLRRYLDGPVDDADVARLDQQFRDLMQDKARRGPEQSAFRANGRRYLGQAWKELLSPHDQLPSPVELALWLAIVTPGYPPPRWYCPEELVGTWRQKAPGEAIWELHADGSFATTDSQLARLGVPRWCVHLVARRGDLYRDHVWLTDRAKHTVSAKSLLITEYAAGRMRLVRSGDSGDIEYQLERIGS